MITVESLVKEFKSPKKYPGLKGALKSLFSLEYETKRAVDNISFNVDDGEMVGYIGVNGAGKSTTIKMLTGILVPTSGMVTVNGRVPWKERKAHSRDIGVVFGQRTQLWWDLPVSESFGILQKIYDIPLSDYKENMEYLRETLTLDEFMSVPVRNLSLGQKMRADLAASLLHRPRILFLDEPTIGLDILVKDRIRKAIRDINKERNTTVILTTHDLDDIEEICDRIIVIDQGRKIYDGGINELKKRYGINREIHLVVGGEPRALGFSSHFGKSADELTERIEDGEIRVRFKRGSVQIPDVINYAASHTEIRDIRIQEPQMEDIVKEIYGGKIFI